MGGKRTLRAPLCGIPALPRCSKTGLSLQFVPPGHDLELATNSVLDCNDRANLEFEGGQHRGELVHFNRVIAIGQHVAAPISNADYEHLDVEIGRLFPFAKNVENSLLRPLVLD